MEPIASDPPQLHFHFVTVGQKGLPSRNRRLVELAESSARSHAARVSHPKYKTRRPSKPSTSPALQHATKVKPEESPPLTMTVPVSTSPLDPFIALSIPLSASERSLVHDYLTLVPSQIYGTTPLSPFCPVRISTATGIATNEIWLRWLLLLVEHSHVLLRGADPDTSPTLIRRRTENYRVMQRSISSPHPDPSDPSSLSSSSLSSSSSSPSSFSKHPPSPEPPALDDELFYALVAAGVAEYRVHNPRAATKHLEAGLAIVDARRRAGLRLPDTGTTGLIACSGYVGDGVANYFATEVALRRVQANVCQRLRAVQAWVLALRQQHGRFGGVGSGQRGRVVGGYVRRVVERAERRGVYEGRTCLGVLFALVSVLWACRHDEVAAGEFVGELDYYIRAGRVEEGEGGTKREDGANGRSLQLAPMTVLWIVAFCGSRIQNKYGGEGRGRRRYDLWDVVDFVELVMLAGEGVRERVRNALGGWILMGFGEGDACDLPVLDAEDAEVLVKEVDVGWKKKQEELAAELMREKSGRL